MLRPESESAINEMCLRCTRTDCPGICDELRDSMGEIQITRFAQTLTWHGVTHTIGEWAEILGCSRTTLYRRLNTIADLDEVMKIGGLKRSDAKFPPGAIEETYVRLSSMHLDYKLYWERMSIRDGSAGLVARYGAVMASPTNATVDPTARRAMPELMLSDEALNRRAWIACVLCVIERYRSNTSNGRITNMTKARILTWRALEGMTLGKIAQTLNEEMYDQYHQVTIIGIRKTLSIIVQDVCTEALKRGLIGREQA